MFQLAQLGSTFQSREFRLLWLATLGSSTGMWIQQVAVGWLVLEMTDSPLALGVVTAARMAPFLVLGIPAGVLADRVDRRHLLVIITALGSAYAIALALLIVTDVGQFGHVVVLTFLFGCTRSFESPARQALVYDLVGSEQALRGISLNAMAQRLAGVIGGLLGGALIPFIGVAGSLMIMALSYAGGVIALIGMRTMGSAPAGRIVGASVWSSISVGLGLIRGNQVVLMLLLMSVVAEIFGFSNATLTPVFARDIFLAGAIGLGMLTAARAVGATAATLILANLTYYRDKMKLLLWALALFGVFLVFFAASESFLVSLVLMLGVGGAAAAFDILQMTILQLSVSDHERGRVMGYWVASLGFGPLGHLELGALAGLVGAPLAQAVNGLVLVVLFLGTFLFASRKLPRNEAQVR